MIIVGHVNVELTIDFISLPNCRDASHTWIKSSSLWSANVTHDVAGSRFEALKHFFPTMGLQCDCSDADEINDVDVVYTSCEYCQRKLCKECRVKSSDPNQDYKKVILCRACSDERVCNICGDVVTTLRCDGCSQPVCSEHSVAGFGKIKCEACF